MMQLKVLRLMFILILIGSCVQSIALATPDQEEPLSPVTLGAADEGGKVQLRLDQPLVIRLPANPSTGYTWVPAGGEELLDLVDVEFVPDSNLLGSPGELVLTYYALKGGLTSVDLVYQRPWEIPKEFVPEATYTIEVEISTEGEEQGKESEIPPESSSLTQPQMSSGHLLPSAFDWRDFAVAAPIRNQGGCGSCWAFGTVGPLESSIGIHEGVSEDLSEQYLLSCNTDGWGCRGGWWAHNYHEGKICPGDSTAGAVLEADFTYTAKNDPCGCPYSHPKQIASWHCIGKGAGKPDCCTGSVLPVEDLKRAIYYYGPISTAVCVGYEFQRYNNMCNGNGLLEPNEVFETDEVRNCHPAVKVNHAVVLVGWDDDLGSEGAWILRNSWGNGWGEDGYMAIGYGVSSVGSCSNYIVYPEGKANCCGDRLPVVLCFGHLPFADGTLPLPFVFENVTFHKVWGEIEKNEGSLWCLGSEESPSGVWHDATVLLGFGTLPCKVCKVVAEIDGHGPKAELTGYLLDGSTQTAVCPGDKQTLVLTTTQDNPFVSVTISGEEAECCCMHLE